MRISWKTSNISFKSFKDFKRVLKTANEESLINMSNKSKIYISIERSSSNLGNFLVLYKFLS